MKSSDESIDYLYHTSCLATASFSFLEPVSGLDCAVFDALLARYKRSRPQPARCTWCCSHGRSTMCLGRIEETRSFCMSLLFCCADDQRRVCSFVCLSVRLSGPSQFMLVSTMTTWDEPLPVDSCLWNQHAIFLGYKQGHMG